MSLLQVWHVSNYIAEMEGEYAEKQPLTIEECAKVAEECLTGRLSVSTYDYIKIFDNLSLCH